MLEFIKKIIKPIKKPSEASKGLPPKVKVICTDKTVRVEHPNGSVEEVRWDEITRVSIITTNEGPITDDIFLCLSCGNLKGCAIPSESDGYDSVYDVVAKFSGFNFQNYITAMQCCENKEFVCWESL